jgi:hypothetical protein
MVRFRKGALDHKPGRRHPTCPNTVLRRLHVLRLATAETGSLRLVVPNTCPSLSRPVPSVVPSGFEWRVLLRLIGVA